MKQSPATVIAVDRHGQLRPVTARIHATDQKSEVAYLGSDSVFSMVSPSTKIQAASGSTLTVSSHIMLESENETFVEVIQANECEQDFEVAATEIWDTLVGTSGKHVDDTLLLRCRSKLVKDDERLTVKIIEDWPYLEITKDEFRRSLVDSTSDYLKHFAETYLWSDQAEAVQFDRGHSYLSLLYAQTLNCNGQTPKYFFDGIQHTAQLGISSTSTARSPLQKIRSSFISTDQQIYYNIEWEDRQCALVCGGLLVTGQA